MGVWRQIILTFFLVAALYNLESYLDIELVCQLQAKLVQHFSVKSTYVAIATSPRAPLDIHLVYCIIIKKSLAQDVNLGLVTVMQSSLCHLRTSWLHVGYKIIIAEERLLCCKSAEESSDPRCSQKLFTTEHPFPLRLHGRHHRASNWCWICFLSYLLASTAGLV